MLIHFWPYDFRWFRWVNVWGSVSAAKYWTDGSPKDWPQTQTQTQTKNYRTRMVRSLGGCRQLLWSATVRIYLKNRQSDNWCTFDSEEMTTAGDVSWVLYISSISNGDFLELSPESDRRRTKFSNLDSYNFSPRSVVCGPVMYYDRGIMMLH